MTTPEEVNEVIAIFAEAKGKKAKAVKLSEEITIPAAILRQSEFLTERVFNTYRCESDLMRYIKRLELRDISLANSMISLGSCTMKLNAAALPATVRRRLPPLLRACRRSSWLPV